MADALSSVNYNPSFSASSLQGFQPQQLAYGGQAPNLLSYTANSIASMLPTTYAGTPIRNFLGVTPAYAASGSASQPTQSVQGASTQNTGGGGSSAGTNSGMQNGGWYGGKQFYNGQLGPSGQANWWQNSGNSGGNSGGGSSANYDQIKGEIGSGFDSYISGLQNQYNQLTPEYNDMQSSVNNDYSGQQNTLQTQNQTDLNNLNASQTDAQLSQSKNLRDLAQQYATQLQGGYNALGASGAGDSSANQMFGYGAQQAARQAQGNLMGQYAGVQNQINLNKNNLGVTYQDQMNQLDNWKNTQLTGLSQWLNDNKSKFQNQIGMSEQQKSQALAAVDQTALSRLQQLDDQATTYRQNIGMAAAQMQSGIGQGISYMAMMGKSIPSNFATPQFNLNAIPQFSGGAGNPAAYNIAGGSAGLYNPNQNQNPAGGSAGLSGAQPTYDQYGNLISQ